MRQNLPVSHFIGKPPLLDQEAKAKLKHLVAESQAQQQALNLTAFRSLVIECVRETYIRRGFQREVISVSNSFLHHTKKELGLV